VLLGGSLKYNEPNPQLFTPLVDGYIVPIQQLARISGKSGLDIADLAQNIIGSGTKDRSGEILRQLGIEGRAFGGPVKAGVSVLVGEPLAGGRVNQELFLPAITTITGIQEMVREASSGYLKPPGKVRRIENLPFPDIPDRPTGPGRLPTELPPTGPGRLPTETTGGSPTKPKGLPTETSGGTSAPKKSPGDFPAPPLPGGGVYDSSIFERGAPGDDAFESASISLRQMYFSPPFITRGGDGDTYDNRRTVEVINPEVNTGLSQIEIAQIKEIYVQLRLEETLT
jgi:hypothetical protein